MDLLGWTFDWGGHCSLLPPVHIESWSYQGSWVIQERPSCVICRVLSIPSSTAFWGQENVCLEGGEREICCLMDIGRNNYVGVCCFIYVYEGMA